MIARSTTKKSRGSAARISWRGGGTFYPYPPGVYTRGFTLLEIVSRGARALPPHHATRLRAESAAVLRDLHTQAAHAARLAASVGTCPGMLVLPDVPINAPRARLEVVWHSCRHRD